MAYVSVEQILQNLSERVRYYELAQRAGDALLEDLNRLEVGALAESLLGTHLRESPQWDEAAWVDSLIGVRLDVTERGVAALSGAAVWRGPRGWFVDPFVARFEFSTDLLSIRTYELQFGDAASGLGSVRYGPDVLSARALPVRWCFVFQESR